MTRWHDEDGNEVPPVSRLTEYGIYVLAGIFYTLFIALCVGALFGLGWVLIYHPAWYGVAAVVMILAAFVLWISWLRSY